MPAPQTRIGKKNRHHMHKAGITLDMVAAHSFDDLERLKRVQRYLQDHGRYDGAIDGMFYSKSCRAFQDSQARSAIIGGRCMLAPACVEWLNYFSPAVHWFKTNRKMEPSNVVVHETVTRSCRDAIAVLTRRHLSCQILIHRDGSVTQHADLHTRCSHAGTTWNRKSIGVDIVNAYYPKYAGEGDRVIDAPAWAHKTGRYMMPTGAQLDTLHRVMEWLPSRAGVPLQFPMFFDEDVFRWGRAPTAGAGIVAHHNIKGGHADGSFPLHYVACRVNGADHAKALDLSVKAAGYGRRNTTHHRQAKGG